MAALPEFPPSLIDHLERIVEFTQDDAVAQRIEGLFREIQVLGARSRKLHEGEMLSVRNLASYILEAAAIYARAESLFGYARGLRQSIDEQPLWERVAFALSTCGINRDEVSALAAEERAHGLPPGEADTLAV